MPCLLIGFCIGLNDDSYDENTNGIFLLFCEENHGKEIGLLVQKLLLD